MLYLDHRKEQHKRQGGLVGDVDSVIVMNNKKFRFVVYGVNRTTTGNVVLNETAGILARRQFLGTFDIHKSIEPYSCYKIGAQLRETLLNTIKNNIDINEMMTLEEAKYCCKEMKNHGILDTVIIGVGA